MKTMIWQRTEYGDWFGVRDNGPDAESDVEFVTDYNPATILESLTEWWLREYQDWRTPFVMRYWTS